MKFSICIILTLLLFCLIECKSSQPTEPHDEKIENECSEKPRADCMCTKQYVPVCGCNNKTYGNACEAECNGITSYSEGACRTGG